MDGTDWLAERFEANRTHLRAVAYRMLGSLREADDVVQDAWFRLSRSDTSDVDNLDGWLTTVVARLSLDALRSRETRREDSLEAHVPDPIIDREDAVDPEHAALLADSVGLALLVVLDTLNPVERLAFVLHDRFAGEKRIAHPALVNGAAGVVVTVEGQPVSVMAFAVIDDKIVEIDTLANPKRLEQLDLRDVTSR